MDTTIQLINVHKEIKKKQIINTVSLNLNSGNIYGFKGVNGSGKTMLMRLIAGLIKPTSGEIIINGKKLGKEIGFPESIGILIENPAFLDPYSGFQNLKMLAAIKDQIGDDRIRETIRTVGLDPDDKKKYRKYSLGMKQRLGIAAVIMEKPDIILLDEPTNALDSDGVEMVKKILQKEKARDALIVISCHDFAILKELSDEIYLIENGTVSYHSSDGEVMV